MDEEINNSTSVTPPTVAPQNSTTVTVESLAPSNRPMQKMALGSPPPKKHKTGLIVGIIIALFILIGGGVAAAILLPSLKKEDPVAAAISKIVKGETPENVAIKGTIELGSSVPDSIVSGIKIDLDSKLRIGSLTNSTQATIVANVRGVGDLEVKISEIHASGDDLFLKIGGIMDALEESGILYLLRNSNVVNTVIDCSGDEGCMPEETTTEQCLDEEGCEQVNTTDEGTEESDTDSQVVLNDDAVVFFSSMVNLAEVIDDEWIRISTDELGDLIGGILVENNATCLPSLISELYSNKTSIKGFYNEHPFILSTDDNIGIESKQYPVRKVAIDAAAFANFVNSASGAVLSDQMYSCVNLKNGAQVGENDTAELVSYLPTIYAEADEKSNFTRLYLDAEIDDGTLEMDLDLTYPSSISVPEPLEYQDFSEILQEISIDLYGDTVDE